MRVLNVDTKEACEFTAVLTKVFPGLAVGPVADLAVALIDNAMTFSRLATKQCNEPMTKEDLEKKAGAETNILELLRTAADSEGSTLEDVEMELYVTLKYDHGRMYGIPTGDK